MVSFDSLGRQARLPQGDPTAQTAGNGLHTEGQPRTAWGGLRGPRRQIAASASGNNMLQARDRHPYLDAGTSKHNAAPSNSGLPNPLASGPARPSLRVVNRQETWLIGTDHTRWEDNDAPKATTSARGGLAADGRTVVGDRAYPLGTQGDTWSNVYGGTPGLYRPYGARGVVFGPPVGSPLDGPQKIRGGAPHGRHSPTVPGHVQTRGRFEAVPQMRPVRVGRPSNSKIAGQSYNQTVVHQGGDTPNPMPTQPTTRTPGMGSRWGR